MYLRFAYIEFIRQISHTFMMIVAARNMPVTLLHVVENLFGFFHVSWLNYIAN